MMMSLRALSSDDEFKSALLTGHYEPLALQGKIIEVDTTGFNKVSVTGLFEQVNAD